MQRTNLRRTKGFTWALRIIATAHLVSVLAQALLAGLFVTGDVDMLAVHSANAGLLYTLALAQLVVAILIWRPGRGPSTAARAATGLFVAESLQWMLGMQRVIALHMPLGVLIFGGAVIITMWAWRFQAWAEQRTDQQADRRAVAA